MHRNFAQSHRQLLDSDCTGLSGAWRRAAVEEARRAAAGSAADGPVAARPARRRPSFGLLSLGGACSLVALAIALAATLASLTDDFDATAPAAAVPVVQVTAAR
jgi:hypothetical protein